MVLVLHVLADLHRTYAMAGLVVAIQGVSTAIGNAWRGRLLTRLSLRRILAPSAAVIVVAGAAMPWIGYWPLLILSAVSGLFALPALAVVRASLDSAVDYRLRPAVMALDSIAADAAFMVGPAFGIAIASMLGSAIALAIFLVAYGLAGLSMWSLEPSTGPANRADFEPTASTRSTSPNDTVRAVTVALAFACALADSAGELSTVAAMKDWHRQDLIGLVISGWAVGSILGGIVFGLLPVPLPSSLLMMGLFGSLALIAAAGDGLQYALLICLNGLFVAPAYAATSSEIASSVPPGRRAEALSWQAVAMVLGTALGTPAVGWVIDKAGWPAGLLVASGAGATLVALRAVLGPHDVFARKSLRPRHPQR